MILVKIIDIHNFSQNLKYEVEVLMFDNITYRNKAGCIKIEDTIIFI
jgi:hypothetical protein